MFIFIIINTPICKLHVIKLVISLKIIVYLLPPSKNKWFKLTSILSYSLKKKKKKNLIHSSLSPSSTLLILTHSTITKPPNPKPMSLPITTTFLFSPPYKLPTFTIPHSSLLFHSPPPLLLKRTIPTPLRRNNPFLTRADDGDADGAGPDDYDMDEDELEEVDNKKDFDIEYHSESTSLSATGDEDIDMVQSKTFVSTQGWDSDMVVDYRINEDEFHKISLLHCDFFIRKPPDPDNDVYDFREVHFF